ncbi:septum formation inhibitor Maf [Shewanella psychropiezotolerans]|uniref:7-methyl-GTP pyrophosphatase n=1 Tax=Shewanella psychropiezotolerans TaxID=2593655 RepID=A0ABX5WZN8_9GAMM|nr:MULTISPECIES: nucleoside triphosphate pyrophosphatase [Shewanella]MPY26293.1 septum formation inhibitor Maf [Shewanella sp. YLB-07]QDO84555.1 septum formation inhibitor Maf [Shewanella psychropiezotolerans]
MSTPIILASTSQYRKQILAKLDLPFSCCDPRVDETHLADESPADLVVRLAEAKAKAGAQQYPEGLVIGSDQVAVIDGKIIGKPLNHETAVKQLTASSGKIITFYTGISLHNIASGQNESLCETFNVHFKHLSQLQIEHYLSREQPYYCAGSFKCEGLGIALFERLEGKDPNTLIGLPLIALTEMLARQGYDVLALR